jgi:hypothetical protein
MTNIQLSSGKFGDQHIKYKTKSHQNYLIWALEQKPGIQYEGCDGKVHTLKEVLVEYGVFHKNAKNSGDWDTSDTKPTDPIVSWFIWEVTFVSTDGISCYSSGHCFEPLQTSILGN